MLSKLIKHEFRATRRVMLPLMAVVLLLSVFAGFSARGLDSLPPAQDMRFVRTLYVLLLFAFFLSLFAVCVVALVLMIQRFYRSLLRDEGYLSMTLPVSVDGHILSKLIVSIVWFFAVALLCMAALLVVVGIASERNLFDYMGFRDLAELLPRLFEPGGMSEVLLFMAEFFTLCLAGVCALCLRCYCAMAVGCSAADHKLLLSFVAYFLISFGASIINTNLFALSGALLNSDEGFHTYLWLSALLQAVYAAVYYCAARWFLKNKLNLA